MANAIRVRGNSNLNVSWKRGCNNGKSQRLENPNKRTDHDKQHAIDGMRLGSRKTPSKFYDYSLNIQKKQCISMKIKAFQ